MCLRMMFYADSLKYESRPHHRPSLAQVPTDLRIALKFILQPSV